jgi:hypothetical protein
MARQYLARLHELTPVARYELGNRIAAAVAATVSPPPPLGTPPDAYLSAVLAERRSREQARQPAPGWRATAAHPGGPAPEGSSGPAEEPAPSAASEPQAFGLGGFVPPE